MTSEGNALQPWRRRTSSVGAALLLALGALQSGCSWILDDEGLIQDRRQAYRTARAVTPPQVPDDLDGEAIAELMPIRDIGGMDRYRAQEVYELPRPTTLFAREEDRGVRIQSFSGDAWIIAPDPPASVWPRVKQFLSDNGVSVLSEDPEAGLMITNWIQISEPSYPDLVRSTLVNTGAVGPWHQLELRIEQAVRRGSTELHVTQAGRPTPSGRPDFEAGSTSDEAEQELRSLVAEYLAAELGGAGVSFVAQTIAAESKAEIVRRSNAPPLLLLRLPADRAWATVSAALENAEIGVVDSDRDALRYDIRFNELQFRGEEPGWFARFFDFGSDDPTAEGDPYRIALREGSDGFEVFVLDEDDGEIDRETSEQILSVLREFAS